MSFEIKKFMQEKFQPQTKDVPITNKTLAGYFSNGNNVWKIRGLTARELTRTREAGEKYDNLKDILNAIATGNKNEKSDGWSELINFGADVPQDFAKRIETVLIGSVDPALEDKGSKINEREFVLKFSQFFPVEFFDLSNKIYELTGIGGVPGKPKPSGKIQKSEPA